MTFRVFAITTHTCTQTHTLRFLFSTFPTFTLNSDPNDRFWKQTSKNCCDSTATHPNDNTYQSIEVWQVPDWGQSAYCYHAATKGEKHSTDYNGCYVLQGSIVSTMKTVLLTCEQATVDVYITHYVHTTSKTSAMWLSLLHTATAQLVFGYADWWLIPYMAANKQKF